MRRYASLALRAAAVFVPLQAYAENLAFKLENNTSLMIVKFQAMPVGKEGKRFEMLNKKGLWAGKSRRLTIADGTDACVYMTRAVFEHDSLYDVTNKVDFCESDVYTIEE